MSKLALDIFCGSGSFGKVARSFGYEVISMDNRRRKGTCEPVLRADILKVRSTFFNSLLPDVSWWGLPCDIWSNASGGFHLDKEFNPKTLKGQIHLDIFEKTISIIEELLRVNPGHFYFIENPRGKLHKYPGLKKFISRTGGKVVECTLSSYGFPTTKPTVIITNYQAIVLKELDSFGRGAKCKVPGTFNNLTKVQRQATPAPLIKHILNQVTYKTEKQ